MDQRGDPALVGWAHRQVAFYYAGQLYQNGSIESINTRLTTVIPESPIRKLLSNTSIL